MIVLIATSGPAIDWSEPDRAELEAVAGEGERAGAVAVAGVLGQRRAACRRRWSACPSPSTLVAPPLAICSNTSVSCSPRKIEMIAGGASLAPRRWSLRAEATTARSRPPCWCTARITAAQNTRNCAFSCGVSPGFEQVALRRVAERAVDVLARAVDAGERLLVQQARPCRTSRPPGCSVTISSCWWSVARLAVSNTGAISYWPGATSLWRVLTGMPSLNSSRSTSSMKASTRSGMAPK